MAQRSQNWCQDLSAEDILFFVKCWESLGRDCEKLFRLTGFAPTNINISAENLELWRKNTDYRKDIFIAVDMLMVMPDDHPDLIKFLEVFMTKHGEDAQYSEYAKNIMRS